MAKTPESSNGLQPDMFDNPAPPTPKQAVKIGPPHVELVESFKKGRDALLTPDRERDIHEKFKEIKAEQNAARADIAKQIEEQGISGIATITTPGQESALAQTMSQDVSNPAKPIPVLAAYPRARKGNK